MATFAIDIETASPFDEPDDFSDTEYFEPVCIGIGYFPDNGTPITDVLFRSGPWGPQYDARLIDEMFQFYNQFDDIDRTLTFNGSSFDCIHLRNWASDASEEDANATRKTEQVLSNHIDIMPIAVDQCREPLDLEDWRSYVKLEDACDIAGATIPPVYHEDYDLSEEYIEAARTEDDEPNITNKQMPVLTEAYVNLLVSGKTDSTEFAALKTALHDYTRADIEPLYTLYQTLSA